MLYFGFYFIEVLFVSAIVTLFFLVLFYVCFSQWFPEFPRNFFPSPEGIQSRFVCPGGDGGENAKVSFIEFYFFRAFQPRHSFIFFSLESSFMFDRFRDDFGFLDTAFGGVGMGG